MFSWRQAGVPRPHVQLGGVAFNVFILPPPSPHPGEGSDAAQNLWTWWGALLLKKNCGRRRYGRPVQKLM